MFFLMLLTQLFLALHFHSGIKDTGAIVNSEGFVEDLISKNNMGIYLGIDGFDNFDFLIRGKFVFFGLFGDDWNVVLNRLWVENVFDVYTGQVDLGLRLVFDGCEFYMLIQDMLKGKQVLVNIIKVDVTFDFVNQ